MARSLAVIISAKLLKLSKGRIKLVRQERPAKIGELPIRETKPVRGLITFHEFIISLKACRCRDAAQPKAVAGAREFIGFRSAVRFRNTAHG